MTPSAVEQARARWGLGGNSPVLLQGEGDGQAFEDARTTARALMPQLVGLNGIVRKSTIAELEALLASFNIKLLKSEEFNSPGKMLFYGRGRLLIRIKTKGNPPDKKHRVDQPHLSVGLMKDEIDTAFEAELVKFSPTGLAQPKSTDTKPGNAMFVPVKAAGKDGQKVKFDGAADAWARATHFNFAPGITQVT